MPNLPKVSSDEQKSEAIAVLKAGVPRKEVTRSVVSMTRSRLAELAPNGAHVYSQRR